MNSRVNGSYSSAAAVALYCEVDQNNSGSIFCDVKDRYDLSFSRSIGKKKADAAGPLGDLGHTARVLIPQYLR